MTKVPAFATEAAARKRAGAAASEDGFWHRPASMNFVADMLLLLASVLIGYMAVKAVMRLPVFSLQDVVVTSPLGQVTPAQLEYAAASLSGNFFTVNLDVARASFEKLPWVRQAQLRRRWPATVEVHLEEHQAVAYWAGEAGEMRLLNSHGEIFDAASDAKMPLFSGPPDRSALMLARFGEMNTMFEPLGRRIVSLALTGRMAWQVRLDDGMTVELGRDDPKSPLDERLRRFVAAYPQAEEKLGGPLAVADLRYPSGFAVRIAINKTTNKDMSMKGTP